MSQLETNRQECGDERRDNKGCPLFSAVQFSWFNPVVFGFPCSRLNTDRRPRTRCDEATTVPDHLLAGVSSSRIFRSDMPAPPSPPISVIQKTMEKRATDDDNN